MPWVYIPRIARKVFAMPTKKWAIQVVGLLGGLTFAAWCSPSSVGSVLLLNNLLWQIEPVQACIANS